MNLSVSPLINIEVSASLSSFSSCVFLGREEGASDTVRPLVRPSVGPQASGFLSTTKGFFMLEAKIAIFQSQVRILLASVCGLVCDLYIDMFAHLAHSILSDLFPAPVTNS